MRVHRRTFTDEILICLGYNPAPISKFNDHPEIVDFVQWGKEQTTNKVHKTTLSNFELNYPRKLSIETKEILESHPEIQEYLLRTCTIIKNDESRIKRICQIKNKLAERKIAFPIEAIEKCFAQSNSLTILEYYIEHHVPLPDPILKIFDSEVALFLQEKASEHKIITAMTLRPDAEIHDKTLFDIEKKLRISAFRQKIDTFYKEKDCFGLKGSFFSEGYGFTTFGGPKAQFQKKQRPATALPAIR